MKRSIVIILILISYLGIAQQPFYSDRKFISYDGVDTLQLIFDGTNINWTFTSPLKWGNNATWNDTTFAISQGTGNVFVGYNAGESIGSGTSNTFFGYESGFLTTTEVNNTFNGYRSGYSNTGSGNTLFGYLTGEDVTGNGNTFIGASAGKESTSGDNNTYLGASASQNNVTGIKNTYIGSASGSVSTGSSNIFIGYSAGKNNTGDSSVFIGTNAGENETGSGKLIISNDNSAIDSALITGDFAADSVNINGKLSSTYYIGQNYIAGDSTIAIGVIDTHYTINKWVTDISENVTLTDSSMTITANGYYQIYLGISSTHSVNNTEIHADIFVNDVEYHIIEGERKIGTATDKGDLGRGGVKWLNIGDVVKGKVRANKTGTATITHGNLNIVRIN